MLPEEEYKALKYAHQQRRLYPPVAKPINLNTVSHSNIYQEEPKSAWSDSTVSDLESSNKLKKRVAESGTSRPKLHIPTQLLKPITQPFEYSPSITAAMTSRQPSTPPRQAARRRTGEPFREFDPVAYELAQANGRGSIYGAEVLMANSQANPPSQTRTHQQTSAVRRDPSAGSGRRQWAQPQESQLYFRNPENGADNTSQRPPSMDPYAFAMATQGVDHDPRMPLNLGQQHTQYWSVRQTAMTPVRANNRRKHSASADARYRPAPQPSTRSVRPSPQREASQNAGGPPFSTPPPAYRRTPEHERQQPTPPRRPNAWKRLWKRIS